MTATATPRARLDNLAARERRTHVRVSMRSDHPLAGERVLEFVPDGGGAPMLAARSREIGSMATIFHVCARFGEGEATLGGEFRKVADAASFPTNPTLHPWLVDGGVPDVVPLPVVKWRGGVLRAHGGAVSILPLRQNALEQSWLVKATLPHGFHWRAWVSFYDGDPCARVRWRLIWSDQTNPEIDTEIEGLWIESGEPITLDYAEACSMQPYATSRTGSGKWSVQVSGRRGLTDGSGLRGWGMMLGTPKDGDFSKDPEALASIEAALARPVSAAFGCMDPVHWNGAWFAYRNVPVLVDWDEPDRAAFGFAEQQFRQFADLVVRPGDLYDYRRIGMTPKPSVAGDQEEFGLSYATSTVLCGDPRFIAYMQFAFGDHFRGGMYHEANGEPVRASMHPGWQTWSGRTNLRASSDRLGKALYAADGSFQSGRATGWNNLDDEHRSTWLSDCLLALDGCELAEDVIEFRVQTDRAMPNDHVGVTRSSGRLFASWANEWMVLTPAQRDELLVRIRERRGTILRNWRGGAHQNPITPITVNAPAGSNGIRDPETGEDLPVVAVWEHGLWLIGAVALGKVLGDPDLETVAYRVGEWMAKYARVEDPAAEGGFQLIKRQWYPRMGEPQEGEPLPLKLRRVGSWAVTYGDDGTTDWTVAGLAAWARHLLPKYGDDAAHEAWSEIARKFGVDLAPRWHPYHAPNAYRDAQWMASTDLVPPADTRED